MICAKYGFVPNVVHEANNINSIIQLGKKGLGVSILPASIAENYDYAAVSFYTLENIDLFTEVLLTIPKAETSEITQTAIKELLSLKT